jgi:LDH2 family malate/lactate/ureidoglycolate dehydrogenase
MIEILTGVLSGGASGNQVQGLYADMTVQNDCSHFFVALDPGAFGRADDFQERVAEFAAQILASPPAPGVDRVMLPGQLELERFRSARMDGIPMSSSVMQSLEETASAAGVEIARSAQVS